MSLIAGLLSHLPRLTVVKRAQPVFRNQVHGFEALWISFHHLQEVLLHHDGPV